jgi:predicted metalloendopeptidase
MHTTHIDISGIHCPVFAVGRSNLSYAKRFGYTCATFCPGFGLAHSFTTLIYHTHLPHSQLLETALNRTLLCTLLCTPMIGLLAHSAVAADAAQTSATGSTLASGIETGHADPAVRAQDDFFRHVNGSWLKSAEIPADRPVWGSFHKLRDDVLPKLRRIIEDSAQTGATDGSDSQKIGDMYASFMDEKNLNDQGLAPLKAELAQIAKLNHKNQLPALIAHLNEIGVKTPFGWGVGQDNKDSTRYVVSIGQNGLGLPDRDYYLKQDDARLREVRAQYVRHIEQMLTLAGQSDAKGKARRIMALETRLAHIQWTQVQNRDPQKTYNKVDLAGLDKLTPGYSWQAYLQESRIAGKADYVIVGQPSYFTGFAALVKQVPLADWRAYFEWHLLSDYAEYLSQPLVDADFAFKGPVLSGAKQIKPRWKRAIENINLTLGESLGKLYVEQNFPQQSKARMETLVGNLLTAFKQGVDTLDWMGPETKKEALTKLAKFTPKIGYPSKWRDYSQLKIVRGDLVGNLMRAVQEEQRYQLAKLGQPIDRTEWHMTPQTVNAYYNAEMNEIVFPAAILQPPFFDMNADDAVNYGAIGAVIGHEISHGFDDQGAQFDGDGNLRDWWSKEDRAKFAAKGKALAAQYNQYSPLPGYKVNGELTLGENIADNSGLAIAYKAYKISLGGKPAPVIGGLSGDQRFYLGFAQIWRGKAREQEVIARLKTDSHSPFEFRTNGTLKNQSGFYQTFDVKPGDKMYLPPEQRVSIW